MDNQRPSHVGTNGAFITLPATEPVTVIEMKVQPFYKIDPQIWFIQLESLFSLSAIVTDIDKYHTLVGVIETDILATVRDIVFNPPAINRYETIKARLIGHFTRTDRKKPSKTTGSTE